MPMATPERALCICLELVLIFGMIDHSLSIIHNDAAVGETALQHQAVMYPDMVVYAAVISSAVYAKRTVPFRNRLVVYLLVPFADRLILVKVVQAYHRRRVPVVVVTFLDDALRLRSQKGLNHILGVHATTPHRFAPNFL